MTQPSAKAHDSRRQFLQASAAGAAALGTLAIPKVAYAAGGDRLRVGLIGCGGRGSGAAINALRADPQAELVAVGDTFRDRAESALKNIRNDKGIADQVKVEPDAIFSDFDNYKKVVDNVDVVLLATPPHFRPQHLAYAVEQGKHCFVEKPIAVDVPGVKSVQETCKKAEEKGLAIVSGLCWRYDSAVRETMQQIMDEKAIGDIVAIESSYNALTLWHRGQEPSWSEMEYQIRNWLYFTWLSGDHIMEQAIHSLDKTAWLLGDAHPVRAMAMGGRQQRTDEKWGNIYDHFTVFYEYADGRRVYFTCRQQDNTSTHVDERVLATNGQADVLGNTLYGADGKPKWRYRGKKPSMYDVEHQEMFQSIRSGSPINNGHYMCNSTMIALMGRMAAYTGKTLTWDECLASTEQLGPTEYAWADAPESVVAIPGRTKLA